MPFRLPLSRAPARRTTLLARRTPLATTTTITSTPTPRLFYSADAHIKFDQTKKSNEPGGEPRSEKDGGGIPADKQPHDDHQHPAKQSDPQPAPARSTGVMADGPGGKAGEGKEEEGQAPAPAGKVSQADKDAVDGAMQHSIKRPIPGGGDTSKGRGGDAFNFK